RARRFLAVVAGDVLEPTRAAATRDHPKAVRVVALDLAVGEEAIELPQASLRSLRSLDHDVWPAVEIHVREIDEHGQRLHVDQVVVEAPALGRRGALAIGVGGRDRPVEIARAEDRLGAEELARDRDDRGIARESVRRAAEEMRIVAALHSESARVARDLLDD